MYVYIVVYVYVFDACNYACPQNNSRPVYLSEFGHIIMEVSWQNGCTHIFLKIGSKIFQKVWKS